MYTIKFIDEKNKLGYKKQVLKWLESDYYELGQPKNHFWHSQRTIAKSFDDYTAMVALNNQKEVVGYMVWLIIGIRAEIDIVEVKKDYRRRGICKRMLADFSNKFTNISVLSGSVLLQAEKAFEKMDWKIKYGCNNTKKYIKIIRPGLQPFNILPNDRVIAVCSQTEITSNEYTDCYTIQDNPKKYQHLIKYFKIDLNEDGSLTAPIITDFHYEGYIGVYFNKKLIIEGKLRHIFSNDREMCNNGLDLLVMNKIKPLNLKLFHETGFFPMPQRQPNGGFSPLFLPTAQEQTHLPQAQQSQNHQPSTIIGNKRSHNHLEKDETSLENQPPTKKQKINHPNVPQFK
jgi:hypothetical protein